MKILALRGENLASLQSRFEIDFASSQLGNAGLFAITGKTGAGKSTLLDAVCLALYGRIPRLQINKQKDAEIGRDDDDNRIKANDVRSILSRGKGEAFAEVDFLANDGTRWRAHWKVRRAWGKAEGPLQDVDRWLEHLGDSQRFSDKKKEVQNEIQRLIGLNFEQFRRAVMLPQGEFAAFLKAEEDERAFLLERMTSSEIYSRLSVLAHKRAKDEKGTYDQLQEKLGDVVLLSGEDKQALTTQAEALKQQAAQLSTQLTELKQHQAILATTEKLAQRVMETQQQAEAAQQQLAAVEPRYQYLELLNKVQPARSDFSLLQQAQVQLAKLRQTLSASLTVLPEKEQALQDRDTQLATVNEALLKAQQDWKALEPKLRAAAKLDQQCEGLKAQLAELEQEQLLHSQSLDDQGKTLAQFKQQQAELQERQQYLTEQLTQNQAIKTVAEHYASVRDNLAQYLAAQQVQVNLLAEKEKIADEQLAHQRQQAALVVQLDKLQADKAQYELRSAETDLDALEQLHGKSQTEYADKQQFRDLLRQALSALKEWMSVLEQAEKSQLEQAQLQKSVDAMQQSHADLLPELQALTIRHDECERSVQQSRAVMDLDGHRAELRPDEACPLCGSLEHPYALENPLADDLLQSQQLRFDQLASELKQKEIQRSNLEQGLPKEQARLLACQDELTHFRQRGSEAFQHFQQYVNDVAQRDTALFGTLGLPATLNEQADMHALTPQLTDWEQAIKHSDTLLSDLHQTNEQRAGQLVNARQVQSQLQQLQQKEHDLNTEINALTQQSTQWQERLQSLAEHYEVQGGILAGRIAALETNFAGSDWQQQLQALGEKAYFQQLDNKVQAYRKDQQALTDTEQEGATLLPKITATQEALAQAQLMLDKQAAKINVLTEQVQSLYEQRTALITEPDLAQLESTYQQAIESAQQGVESALTAQRQAGEALAALQAALNSTKQQETEAEVDLQSLRQRWTAWQQKLNLDEDQLTTLLAKDEVWLVQERAALKAIEQAADSGQVTLKAREQDLQEQEQLAAVSRQWLATQFVIDGCVADEDAMANGAIAKNTEQQSALATRWQQQKEGFDEQVFQCRQQLRADEQARISAGSLTEQLTKQQACTELWEKMNELIGSATGNKFRSLAQSLTLQQLVILANEHLQDLAPRYALQPVPGSGLALQVVDHDMGDEVRSVESLSGGESFLVSLALALALASLAADTRQLGSLFIDEGFGTLDPDSLEMALACLDALQADGRQIGVISHVSTLVERIGVQVKVEAMGGGRSRVVIE